MQLFNFYFRSVTAARLGRKGVGYIDVTNIEPSKIPQRERDFPSKPAYQKLIDPLLLKLSDANLLAYDTKLSSFPTRVSIILHIHNNFDSFGKFLQKF